MVTATPHTDWLDPAWEATAHAWIRDRQRALGMPATGPIERFRARPWSVVLKVATPDGPLWFKANTPASAFEAALCDALAGWVPDRVVAPLAVDLDRGWMLSADAGPTLRDETPSGSTDTSAGLTRWEPMLRAYAQLQRELAGRAGAMVDLGVPDLRPAAMPGHLAALLDDPGVRQGLGADRYATVRELVPQYVDWCAELAGDGVPASLQHDDLSDANVFVSGGRFRFFDWADAGVAHPFGSLLVVLHVVMYRFDLQPRDPRLARLRDTYLEPWATTYDPSRLERSVTLAMRVAKVGRSVSWRRALRGAALPVEPAHATAAVEWLAALSEPDIL